MTKHIPSYTPRQYVTNPPARPIGRATVSVPATNQRSPHIPAYAPRYETPMSNKPLHDQVRALQSRVHKKG